MFDVCVVDEISGLEKKDDISFSFERLGSLLLYYFNRYRMGSHVKFLEERA